MRRPYFIRSVRPNFAVNGAVIVAIVLVQVLISVQPAYSAPVQETILKPATSIPADARFRAGQVIVKFKDSAVGQFDNLAPAYLENNTSFSLYRNFHLQYAEGIVSLPGHAVFTSVSNANVREMVEAFSLNPAVEYAEPNYTRMVSRTPNDTFYSQARQYYIDKVNLPAAWDVTTGSNKTVIAVIDTGVRNNLRFSEPLLDDIYGSYVPIGNLPSRGSPPARYPDGPAPPLDGIAPGDQCYWPQPTPYPIGDGSSSDTNLGCDQSPLAGGQGVKDLRGRVVTQQGFNTVPDCQPPRWDPRSPECNTDYEGHGTAVSGVIAANSNNGYGMTGVDWGALILPVRACNWQGACDDTWVAAGITYAADRGARVLNLSLGGPNYSRTMEEAIRYAMGKGAIVVSSSGNAANGVTEYPAAYKGVIAVAATDENNKVAKFSSFGAWVSVAAPGSRILTTNLNWPSTGFGKGDPFLYNNPSSPVADRGDWVIVDGTSFSAPIVSGIIGLMLSVKPDLTAEQVKAILEGTAVDIEEPGRDFKSGYGLVDAYAAVVAARDGNLTPGRNSSVYGLVRGALYPDVLMTLEPGQLIKNLDNDGNYRFANLGAGVYTLRAILPKANRVLGPVTITVNGASGNDVPVNFDFATGQIIAGPGAVGPGSVPPGNQGSPNQGGQLASQSIYFNRVAAIPDTADARFFPETGHTLKGEFKKYWDRNGGLPVFGFPISEEFQEVSKTDGRVYTVQYFERNRFEYHPEFTGSPFVVLLGLLGSESTRDRNFPASQTVPSSASLLYFNETQHTLSGRFLEYWSKKGGLAIFGYPISEPVLENGLMVQYFQRNRFEYHPEKAGSEFDVLLGLLGVDLARSRNYIR
jgi:hypothetical protein